MLLLEWNRKLKNNAKEIQKLKQQIGRIKEKDGSNRRDKLNELNKRLVYTYKKEKIFWEWKARITLIQKGNKNIGYFHATIEARKKRNTIHTLQKENGTWCDSEKEMELEIIGYFEYLLKSF